VLIQIDLFHLEQNLARQRKAVGVQAGRRQTDEQIAFPDLHAVDDAVAGYRPDDSAGQVVLSGCIKPRHLRGFASDQGAAVFAAGFGHPANKRRSGGGIEHPDAKVVEKKERIGPAGHDIVDTMIDQILAD